MRPLAIVRRVWLACSIAAAPCAFLLPAADPVSDTAATEGPAPAPRLIEAPGSPLHNLIQVSPRLYSGSEPIGSEGFARLQEMGVTTVVSVDGAPPDAATAREFGLRYVHIPFGYDGIGREQQAALTRVMRDLAGPIYVHCHHGRHRGPAGAAICAMADGALDHAGAEQLLKLAHTSPDYAGLYRDVASFIPLAADADLPELIESAPLEPLTMVMARNGRLYDELIARQKQQWAYDTSKPVEAPQHTALLLSEEFREAGRGLSAGYGEEFRVLMKSAEEAALVLSDQLKAGNTEVADRRLNALEAACNGCHAAYRN